MSFADSVPEEAQYEPTYIRGLRRAAQEQWVEIRSCPLEYLKNTLITFGVIVFLLTIFVVVNLIQRDGETESGDTSLLESALFVDDWSGSDVAVLNLFLMAIIGAVTVPPLFEFIGFTGIFFERESRDKRRLLAAHKAIDDITLDAKRRMNLAVNENWRNILDQ